MVLGFLIAYDNLKVLVFGYFRLVKPCHAFFSFSAVIRTY